MQPQKEINVLIAEDDFNVSGAIQKELEHLGYTIAGIASNGRQAIEMTQSLQPDVVLMDIEMPRMDGLEATQHIHQTCPTPVVILTAYDKPELVKLAGEAGAGAYLVKMPKAREIERAITIAAARFDDMMTLRRLNVKRQRRNEQLEAALDKVKQLSGLLPICSNCKKIRDKEDCWHDVAVYIRDHSDADFTHGICPECIKKLYPELQGLKYE